MGISYWFTGRRLSVCRFDLECKPLKSQCKLQWQNAWDLISQRQWPRNGQFSGDQLSWKHIFPVSLLKIHGCCANWDQLGRSRALSQFWKRRASGLKKLPNSGKIRIRLNFDHGSQCLCWKSCKGFASYFLSHNPGQKFWGREYPQRFHHNGQRLFSQSASDGWSGSYMHQESSTTLHPRCSHE